MKTLVTFLLDKSGSMQSVKSPTIEGFNSYLEALKEGESADETEFTFLHFDSYSLDKIHVNAPVKAVPNLDEKSYVPRGGTPLIEASIKTIEAVDRAVGSEKKQVVICIHTDGLENASGPEYTWERLNNLIKEKIKLGWQFNFMGVGIDAYDQGKKMGINVGSTMSTTTDPMQMKRAYSTLGGQTAMYASGQSGSTEWSLSAKAGAGDYTATGGNKPTTAGKTAPIKQQRQPVIDDFDLN